MTDDRIKELAIALANKNTIIKQLRAELAAAQATIAEMREADLKIVGRNLTEEMALAAARLFDKANGRRVGAETLWQVLFDAAPPLAIPTNQDALHEARAQALEEAVANWSYGLGGHREEIEVKVAVHCVKKG